MAKVLYENTVCELEAGETVLDCLLRHDFDIVYSCRTGKCHACLLRVKAGPVPEAGQKGLKETWRERGYFMPCVSRLVHNEIIDVGDLNEGENYIARILSIEKISTSVARVRLEVPADFSYHPGQFITIVREGEDSVARSYSLASVPSQDFLELHIRRWPGGQMSTWIHDELRPGDSLAIRGPYGDCFYVGGQPERPLLLIGTGTGAAPLWGIARHALISGHTGPIQFMHKGHDEDALYLHDELQALAHGHETFTYHPCVTIDGGDGGVSFGSIIELARNQLLKLDNPLDARAYICGNPDVVKMLRKELFLAGMPMREILYDAFVFSTTQQKRSPGKAAAKQAAASS